MGLAMLVVIWIPAPVLCLSCMRGDCILRLIESGRLDSKDTRTSRRRFVRAVEICDSISVYPAIIKPRQGDSGVRAMGLC